MSTNRFSRRQIIGGAAAGLGLSLGIRSTRAASRKIEDFSFIQVSDLHMDPRPEGSSTTPSGNSVDTIAWVCEQAHGPQSLGPNRPAAPPPAFVMATGDLTEYGVIAHTWKMWEQCWAPLGIPLYITPGNHDGTWTGILPLMRKLHGGDNYSFDCNGIHFVGFNSAGLQEPLPSLEQRLLTWLEADLRKIDQDTPVILFCHHPLSTSEYAEPHEQLRFLDVIENHNVVVLCMGHGHSARAERWNSLDSVMGGSTFGGNTGYSIISVMDGVLRVVYRFRDEKLGYKVLLEKPIAPKPRPKLVIDAPSAGAAVSGQAISVRATAGNRAKLSAGLDGAKEEKPFDGPAVELPCTGLLPGRHFVKVTAAVGKLTFEKAREFTYTPASTPMKARVWQLLAGIKAGPLMSGGRLLVCDTAGAIRWIDPTAGTGKLPRPIAQLEAEILHTPALAGETLYVGSGDLTVTAMGAGGKIAWKCPTKGAAYGTPAFDGQSVYAADLEGYVYAINRADGKPRWARKHASLSIEMPVTLHQGVLYFGAWDGQFYAVSASDGSLKWQARGPAAARPETKFKSRYYAPADAQAVVLGDRIFVADRAYVLGSYSPEGKYLGEVAADVAAVSPTADGQGIYARPNGGKLARYDLQGTPIWTADVDLGRFPIPPVEAAGVLYVCSNTGTLSALDAADGKPLWQYQVTPQLHVMAPLAAAKGQVVAAGMDGTVTLLTA